MSLISNDAYPHLTVSCVVVKDKQFLLVKERSDGKLVLNQPAGHLELNETIIEAAVRETLEETGWHVEPRHLLGISQYKAPGNGVTYIRHSFVADALHREPHPRIDSDIVEVVWMTYDEVVANRTCLRSPLVLNDIERFRAGIQYDIRILEGFL